MFEPHILTVDVERDIRSNILTISLSAIVTFERFILTSYRMAGDILSSYLQVRRPDARLEREAMARETREPRWRESTAGQAYTVARALVDLYAGQELQVAITVIHTHRQGPLQGWIDAQLRRKALRGEAASEEVEELPCGRETLSKSQKELGMLALTPLQRSKPLPRGVRENRWSVAACAAAAGVGLGALTDGGRRLAAEESAAVLVSVRMPVVACMERGKGP